MTSPPGPLIIPDVPTKTNERVSHDAEKRPYLREEKPWQPERVWLSLCAPCLQKGHASHQVSHPAGQGLEGGVGGSSPHAGHLQRGGTRLAKPLQPQPATNLRPHPESVRVCRLRHIHICGFAFKNKRVLVGHWQKNAHGSNCQPPTVSIRCPPILCSHPGHMSDQVT